MSFELIIRVKKLEERIAQLEKNPQTDVSVAIARLEARIARIEQRSKPGPKPKDARD